MKKLLSICLSLLFIITVIVYFRFNIIFYDGELHKLLVEIILTFFFLLTISTTILFNRLCPHKKIFFWSSFIVSVLFLAINVVFFFILEDHNLFHSIEVLMMPLGLLGYAINIFGFALSIYNIIITFTKKYF